MKNEKYAEWYAKNRETLLAKMKERGVVYRAKRKETEEALEKYREQSRKEYYVKRANVVKREIESLISNTADIDKKRQYQNLIDSDVYLSLTPKSIKNLRERDAKENVATEKNERTDG